MVRGLCIQPATVLTAKSPSGSTESQMGTGGMLEHPNRLLVHGFGLITPMLVCAWLQITDHQPHARTGCVDDTKLPQYTVFKKFATHNDGDAPPLKISGKERPKTVPATNVHHPGRRNLHERLGSETRSGETASALSPPVHFLSWGSNVPVLRLGVPMSRGSNVPREGKPC